MGIIPGVSKSSSSGFILTHCCWRVTPALAPVLVFDEIDTGISGQAANSVAEKLSKIAKNHQIICVTHLATIAAKGDSNYYINKEVIEGKTKTNISLLADNKLVEERDKLEHEADRINEILNNTDLFNKEIIKGWQEVSRKFGDTRRTQVLNIEKEDGEVVEEKQLSLSFTNKGAVFVTETSSLYSQRRNGVGTKLKLDKNEFLVDNIIGKNTDTILFFTNKGNYYHMRIGEFSLNEKQYLSNYFTINSYETLTAAVTVKPNNMDKFIIFITKKGLIKKSPLSEYNLKRNTGATAIKLDNEDEIISIIITVDERVGILSKAGQFIMVETKNIKPIGRVTRGIIGMKLNDGDEIVSARAILKDAKQLFTISHDGYGKITDLNEFSVTNTNTKGVKIQRSEEMSDFLPIKDRSDILINSNTTQIRIKYDDIPNLSRGAQGNKLIKLTNNYVIGISLL